MSILTSVNMAGALFFLLVGCAGDLLPQQPTPEVVGENTTILEAGIVAPPPKPAHVFSGGSGE